MTEIHIDRTKTTIISTQYHMLLDTESKVDSKVYGTYSKMYDPEDEDLFEKETKGRNLKLKRVIASGTPRYLHKVSLINKESVRGLAKLFGFTYEWKEDTRTRLIDTEKIVIIDYSPKSVAIFSKDPSIRKKLKAYEDKMMYNSKLTGPDMEKSPGYILAKSNKSYGEILSMFDREESSSDESPEDDGVHKDNGIEQIDSDPISGNDRFKIWGDQTWIDVKIEEIEEEPVISWKKISEKSLSGDRKLVEIELFPKDSD